AMIGHLLSLTLAGPFAAACVVLLLPERARLSIRIASLLGALVPAAASLIILRAYDAARGGFQLVESHALIPRLGVSWHVGVDGIGVAMVFLTAIIHVTSVCTSWSLKSREKEYFLFVALL